MSTVIESKACIESAVISGTEQKIASEPLSRDIFEAIKANRIRDIEIFIQRDPSVLRPKPAPASRQCVYEQYLTPFMVAAQYNSIPAMKLILEHYPDAIKDRCFCNWGEGWTPIFSAIKSTDENNSLEALEFIIKHYPESLDAVYEYFGTKYTPFTYAACTKGSIPAMELILKHEPNSFYKSKWYPGQYCLLKDIVNLKRTDVLRFIFSNGAAVHLGRLNDKVNYESRYKDEENETFQYLEKVRAIRDCVKSGELKELEKWVADGNPINFRDSTDDHNWDKYKFGRTLLDIAIENGQPEIAIYLYEHGLSKECQKDIATSPFLQAFNFPLYEGRKSVESVIALFNHRAQKINDDIKDEKEAKEKIEKLRQEFEALINHAESTMCYVDYECLAKEYDEKYWIQFAKKAYERKKTSKTEKESTYYVIVPKDIKEAQKEQEYYQEKETLGNLIYSGTILCREDENEEPLFTLPEEPVSDMNPPPAGGLDLSDDTEASDSKESKEKDDSVLESEKERFIRLKWALRFAMEGHDFGSATRILMETTLGLDKVQEVSQPSQKAGGLKSTKAFVVNFMKLNYKPRSGKKDFLKQTATF